MLLNFNALLLLIITSSISQALDFDFEKAKYFWRLASISQCNV